MGLGGIGPVQLLVILVIVLLIFGTKKLRNLGGDLGGAIKSFKKAVNDGEADDDKDKTATRRAALGEESAAPAVRPKSRKAKAKSAQS